MVHVKVIAHGNEPRMPSVARSRHDRIFGLGATEGTFQWQLEMDSFPAF
jgi:hypothetical protein